MSSSDVTIEWWIGKVAAAARDFSKVSLGTEKFEVRQMTKGLPKHISGSCIALVGDKCAAQIGICSDSVGCTRLASMMLGLGEGEKMEEDGVTDAICELANVLAGLVKTRVTETYPGFQIGMPVYFQGELGAGSGVEVGSVEVAIDGTLVHLIVLRSTGG